MSARVSCAPRVLAVATALSVTITCAEPVAPRRTVADANAGAALTKTSLISNCTGMIWCDDFEVDRSDKYFEIHDADGAFVRVAGVGRNGSWGLRARYSAGAVDAGAYRIAFGRTPDAYMRPVDDGTRDYREIYWRFYVKNQRLWTGGGGDKLARAMILSSSTWAQAMVAHVWSGSAPNQDYLVLDPVSGTDASGTLRTTTYNDFENFRWLGAARSRTPIFVAPHLGKWQCVEAHVRLNTAGQSNGVFELWVNGQLEAQRTGLNWVGGYDAYGINALFIENYWDDGSPITQRRYFDDFVVSEQPIGCNETPSPPTPVAQVIVTLGASTINTGATTSATAEMRDSSGNVLTGRAVTWFSTDPTVAMVDATSGNIIGMAHGTADIIAMSEGVSGRASLSVHSPIASVAVTLGASSVLVGGATTAVATLRDSSNNVLTGRMITWSSSNNAVAFVDSATGVIRGIAEGTAAIRATSEGITGEATITVSRVPVASVVVSLGSTSILVGQTTVASASTRDSANNVLTGRTVLWSSTSPTIASVNATSGLVTGVAAGTARIIATSEGVTGFADVTVTAPPPPPTDSGTTIWSDDFEIDRSAKYFEINNAGGAFVRVAGVGRNGGWGLRARYAAGAVSVGAYRVAFGRTPDTYMRPVDAGTRNYRELYWRIYLRNQSGWTGGGGDKLLRAMIMATPNWAEAMVAHVWSGSAPNQDYLVLDPVSGTDAAGALRTTIYNDFANFRWLGAARSTTPIFTAPHLGQWQCIEAHVRLNTAGQSNGVFELWVNGRLEAQRTGLNWVGSYSAYGINTLFLENFWNNGSPQAQERYFDDFVVSEQPIGCDGTPPPPPPSATNLGIARQPGGAVSAVELTTQPIVHVRDASGNTVTTSAAPVTAVIASGTGALSGPVTVNAVNGVATFTDLVITGSGPHTLRFSSPGLTSVTSASFTVAAGPATQLTVTTQPSVSAPSGVPFARQPAVQLRDAGGNAVSQSGVAISAEIATGGGTLGGSLTATTNANGVATFANLSITGTAGSRTLRFIGASLSPVTSNAIAITDLASQLAITTQPSTTASSGIPFSRQPVIQLRDAGGNAVGQAGVIVTAAIASGTGTLGGTPTATTNANGTATFTNLSITGSGTFTLSFSSMGLTGVNSGGITMTQGVTPLTAIDFDGYASTAALLADCTRWNCIEDVGTGDMTLDATVAPPGATKSMRYRYNHGGNGCTSITRQRAFLFPSRQQEVWAEFKIRWSSNFTTENVNCLPNDHKLIFGDTEADQSGRWAFYVGAGSPPAHALQAERPTASGGSVSYLNQNSNPSLSAQDLWDGQWHVVRLHLKHSTTASSGDGIIQIWVDGVLKHDERGFNTAKPASEGGGADRIIGFSFTHNKDDGPPGVDMFLWWGPITVYNINPGW